MLKHDTAFDEHNKEAVTSTITFLCNSTPAFNVYKSKSAWNPLSAARQAPSKLPPSTYLSLRLQSSTTLTDFSFKYVVTSQTSRSYPLISELFLCVWRKRQKSSALFKKRELTMRPRFFFIGSNIFSHWKRRREISIYPWPFFHSISVRCVVSPLDWRNLKPGVSCVIEAVKLLAFVEEDHLLFSFFEIYITLSKSVCFSIRHCNRNSLSSLPAQDNFDKNMRKTIEK